MRRLDDRRVHARSAEGMEVVRYDRAGKWYLEPPKGLGLKRQSVKIGDAVRFAVWAAENGGAVHFGLAGGTTFDARVKAMTNTSLDGSGPGETRKADRPTLDGPGPSNQPRTNARSES